MQANLFQRSARVAAFLAAGIAMSHGAAASEITPGSGQITYTTGTATVRTAVSEAGRDVLLDGAADRVITGPWQVASVDAALLEKPASLITMKPASFELPSIARIVSDTTFVERESVLKNVELAKGREPGFWATALSTAVRRMPASS